MGACQHFFFKKTNFLYKFQKDLSSYAAYDKINKNSNRGVIVGIYGSPDLTNNTIIDKNMIYCMSCGFRYSKKTKRCPHCGKKRSQPFYHKWWFWFIVLIIACSNFYPPNTEVNDADSESNSGNVKQITMTEEYKASCNSVSYIEIARNPNNYIGQKAVFSGKVIQVQENGEIKGIKDYTAVLGNQIPIPHLEAEYIEIN